MILFFIVGILICILAYKSIIFLFSPLSTTGMVTISSVTDEKETMQLSPSEYVKQEAKLLGIGIGNEQIPLKVEIKEGQIDPNKIKDYTGHTIKSYEFRPYDFKTFIGQKEAKERINIAIKKVEKGLRGHIFIDGRQGVGKTSFVKIIANMLNARLIVRVGKQVDPEELTNIINEINSCPEDKVVFFCDEMDSMDKKTIKMLNPIIEEFMISDKKIKPFIFCGASIQKSTLLKNNPDTMDRIQIHLKFERYTIEELTCIINQYVKYLFPDEILSENDVKHISMNCKFTPRIAIALAEELIIVKNLNQVLKNWKIVINGLTDIDVRVLKMLVEIKRPIGANALAQRCKLTELEYLREIEPFLCEEGYILRVPSRLISDKGRKLLEILNGKKEI